MCQIFRPIFQRLACWKRFRFPHFFFFTSIAHCTWTFLCGLKKKKIVEAFYHPHNLRAMTMILVLYKHRDEKDQTIITSPIIYNREIIYVLTKWSSRTITGLRYRGKIKKKESGKNKGILSMKLTQGYLLT